jgi:hypothetical protein
MLKRLFSGFFNDISEKIFIGCIVLLAIVVVFGLLSFIMTHMWALIVAGVVLAILVLSHIIGHFIWSAGGDGE